jgi:hypothetical protein
MLRVYGQVTYVNRELDGDIHIVLKAPDGAFVVLEIIPHPGPPRRRPHHRLGHRPPRRPPQLVGTAPLIGWASSPPPPPAASTTSHPKGRPLASVASCLVILELAFGRPPTHRVG